MRVCVWVGNALVFVNTVTRVVTLRRAHGKSSQFLHDSFSFLSSSFFVCSHKSSSSLRSCAIRSIADVKIYVYMNNIRWMGITTTTKKIEETALMLRSFVVSVPTLTSL